MAYVAIHLITESCDHSTHLMEYLHIDDVVDDIKEMFGGEFAYIQGIHVAAEVAGDTTKIERAIREAVDEAMEECYE
ncbi:hypothetical protein PMW_213 [Pseudomonas phage phiPMW]|uniref:Uncharacterized protein n=1 Tax=Pseudomonas phage phiPMW TaxID=1815582 RepID=A0A1S5R1T1_9CAUD|nr:hypothetical protein FDG97_gp137 [Pseudomonas phage phiPMW]ANA49338.1 hypothetical protein PMW_213 [Pseudomonas phage phiPMW]